MSEVKCDISYCDAEGDNPFTKYINLCGNHWFMIMNRVMEVPQELIDLEKKRIKEEFKK